MRRLKPSLLLPRAQSTTESWLSTYLSKEWNCMGRIACASLFRAGSGYGMGSGPHSTTSTGVATRLFRISLTLMPLVWLMLDMDGAGFNISLGGSAKLSCDFFTSDDKVDSSSLMASGPGPGSNSAPFRMLATCSSPIPESVWGMELPSCASSLGAGASFSFTGSGNAAGVSVRKENGSDKKSKRGNPVSPTEQSHRLEETSPW